MKNVSRFIPNHEKKRYSVVFARTTFTDVLSKLNLGGLKRSDIVKDTYLAENGSITETNKLMDFGDKAQVVLKHYDVEVNGNIKTADVVHVWMQGEDNVTFQGYSNGNLIIERTMDEMVVYADYKKTAEVAEENEAHLAEITLSGLSCINKGSCCYFDGMRYEHCGQTCGNYNKAGGGTPINYVDRCCLLHDRDLQGPRPISRCAAHKKFLNCSAGRSGPGVRTIRAGITFDATIRGCTFIIV